jgi:hypothetical protein
MPVQYSLPHGMRSGLFLLRPSEILIRESTDMKKEGSHLMFAEEIVLREWWVQAIGIAFAVYSCKEFKPTRRREGVSRTLC